MLHVSQLIEKNEPVSMPESSYVFLRGNDPYILERTPRRIARAGMDWEPVAAFAGWCHGAIPYGCYADWQPVIDWLDEQGYPYIAWTPFSNGWRAYFGFRDSAAAVAFRLRWAP